MPTEHAAQTLAPGAAYNPAKQNRHATDDPVVAEYLPKGQFKQPVAPISLWYVPTEQPMQTDASTEPTAAENEPAAQLSQPVAAWCAWYLPPMHGTHPAAPEML